MFPRRLMILVEVEASPDASDYWADPDWMTEKLQGLSPQVAVIEVVIKDTGEQHDPMADPS